MDIDMNPPSGRGKTCLGSWLVWIQNWRPPLASGHSFSSSPRFLHPTGRFLFSIASSTFNLRQITSTHSFCRLFFENHLFLSSYSFCNPPHRGFS